MANPNDELLKALHKLEDFTRETSKEITRFEEIKDLLQELFFSERRKAKDKKKQQIKKELIRSVGIVKNYLSLIDKYRSGSPEEQKFAELITKTINNYNEALKISEEAADVAKLIIENKPRVAYRRGASEKKGLIDQLFSSKRPPKNPISKEEQDTLKMKAIRLIEGEGYFKESLIESLKNKELGEFHEIQNQDKTVTLIQTWSELPGEVHRIIGDFKRESKHSIPIKDSFKLFLESSQPGHPYPPQRMGWSLSHWLIPSSVLWIDQIPLLQPLIERKNRAAEALLPNGSMNLKARKLFRFKKKVFDSSHLEYLTYHQELAHAIVKASPYGDEKVFHKVINHFFETLAEVPAPFEALSQAIEEMNLIFIESPFEKIEEIRLSGHYSDLFALYDKERARYDELFEQNTTPNTPFEEAKKDYLLYMGRLIGEAASLLLKLQLSEKLKVKPPPLSDFELKIQAAAFKHLLEFLEELENEINLEDPQEKETLKQKMRKEIGSEIELFSAPSFEEVEPALVELTEETVGYYHAQFYGLSK